MSNPSLADVRRDQVAELSGSHRHQLTLPSHDGEWLRNTVRRATTDLRLPDDVVWTVDVDPLDMM